jgi:hypothetical protein
MTEIHSFKKCALLEFLGGIESKEFKRAKQPNMGINPLTGLPSSLHPVMGSYKDTDFQPDWMI